MAEEQNITVPIAAEMIRDLMTESFIKTSNRVYDISMISLYKDCYGIIAFVVRRL